MVPRWKGEQRGFCEVLSKGMDSERGLAISLGSSSSPSTVRNPPKEISSYSFEVSRFNIPTSTLSSGLRLVSIPFSSAGGQVAVTTTACDIAS